MEIWVEKYGYGLSAPPRSTDSRIFWCSASRIPETRRMILPTANSTAQSRLRTGNLPSTGSPSPSSRILVQLNCQVIGASVDSHFCHLAWINTPKKQGGLGPMNIPLVSDPKRTIAQDYGVLKVDEGISFRGLFIIDDKGILRQITVNDLPVGRSVDETLRLVQAFQFTDKHGEVCPAGWKPGSDTIKPDVQKSKEYFSKQK
ncbi:peroxiredoxin-1-like isoform X3 [Canis lupus familiaris]|uniref:peroxiredoxin-1-like isoform X3 n=2 Tax=Canis lupus TaxID=9612 RepID=UPI0018F4F4D7|nr:peroxiredoxin-1-like isoform X3 [Canis lupus familiaris]